MRRLWILICQSILKYSSKVFQIVETKPLALEDEEEILDYIREKLSEGYSTRKVWEELKSKFNNNEISLADVREIIHKNQDYL